MDFVFLLLILKLKLIFFLLHHFVQLPFFSVLYSFLIIYLFDFLTFSLKEYLWFLRLHLQSQMKLQLYKAYYFQFFVLLNLIIVFLALEVFHKLIHPLLIIYLLFEGYLVYFFLNQFQISTFAYQ